MNSATRRSLVGYFQVGDAIVTLCEGSDGTYSGTIFADPTTDPAGRAVWHFDGLHGPACGVHDERDLALAATGFGGYYTSDNRGDDVPEWAPAPVVADAICQAAISADESDQVTELDESELPGWVRGEVQL